MPDAIHVDLLDWLTLLVGAVGATATASLAYLVDSWTKSALKNEVTRSGQTDWRNYNLAVMADEDLQDLERQNHLIGGLSHPEIKKMCISFIKIYVPYNMWIAQRNDLFDAADVDREIANQARLLFRDRTLFRRHVFLRGYDPAFCKLFQDRWDRMAAAT
ncbi:hypothetical protein [Jannaschia sp. M317]|uniref:hypothetical protein n=1 Tax=Jannaschia sp. M317 TaxID=2867011 RepID=UPI0021A8781B|nr:hypothetical protein [Jannaschia sp. M317]UWQ18532.1 hypothetical protein K3551_04330 [Jannaschia sp. M317]